MRGGPEHDDQARVTPDADDFYRHLVENSLGLICCHNFEGMLLMVNAAAAQALGYRPEELIGRRLPDFMPPDLRPRFAKYLHRVTTVGEARGYLTLVTKSGETVTWVYRNTAYGTSPVVIGHAQDITWRLAMERSLKHGNEQFRALFEDAPVAYHEIDCRGIVVRVNNAECEMLGRGKHAILGHPVWDLVVPEQREQSKRDVEMKLSGELEPSQVFREYIRRDGRRLYLSIHDKAIRSPSGDITGIRSTLLDMTEQHRIETELRNLNAELDRRVSERTAELNLSNERLQEFVYTVSHDLQEPLRAIIGFGALLSERYRRVLDADGVEFLEYITSGAGRMSSLLTDLLAYSRVLHDRSPARKPVSLEDILRIAEENLWSAIQDTGAVITHDALPVVNANLNRMVQLIQNLLSNSMKYRTDQPPRIRLSAERRAGSWMVSVLDNGTGVDEAHRERIFHLFRRSGERRTPGSGVGLAICRAIVQQHGGEIWVEPVREGGSNFCFTLPDVPAQEHNNDSADV
jgi:PAS domain S-box-containing protein